MDWAQHRKGPEPDGQRGEGNSGRTEWATADSRLLLPRPRQLQGREQLTGLLAPTASTLMVPTPPRTDPQPILFCCSPEGPSLPGKPDFSQKRRKRIAISREMTQNPVGKRDRAPRCGLRFTLQPVAAEDWRYFHRRQW
ncbi:hypothetical protein PAL_GLEAN10008693 [Pteropus alecto]|uniref:Uncharacterized protein n=1 Tax=Pteropus alecto TaxID=9402 RepID=L5KS36_PTEAL|nr:hypothetical protein PAL_GLEAN10008693 [Pteropus alecto]